MTPRRATRRAALVVAFLALTCVACTAPTPPRARGEAISRELFIETYVDLRLEGLRRSSGYLVRGEHEAVLARHGVTEEEMRAFIAVHGGDVPFMSSLWSDVQERIRADAEGR